MKTSALLFLYKQRFGSYFSKFGISIGTRTYKIWYRYWWLSYFLKSIIFNGPKISSWQWSWKSILTAIIIHIPSYRLVWDKIIVRSSLCIETEVKDSNMFWNKKLFNIGKEFAAPVSFSSLSSAPVISSLILMELSDALKKQIVLTKLAFYLCSNNILISIGATKVWKYAG